jgi:site-specific recombinase XerD
MSVKDSERENFSSGGGLLLVGSTTESNSESDESENSDNGRIILNFKSREVNGEESVQVTPRAVDGMFGRRVNDEGQQMVLDLLRVNGVQDYSEWFFKSLAETTLRNYRRGFTLFHKLLVEERLDIDQIKKAEMALAVMVRVLKVAFQKKLKLSAVSTMKTAMVRIFDFIFNIQFEELPILKMAMKFYSSGNLPKKEMLKLQWSVDALLQFLMTKVPFKEQKFNELVDVCIVLCMAFTTLRFTELFKLEMDSTDPDVVQGVWKMWSLVKGHNYLEPVFLHTVDEPHLDPIMALVELRRRIREIDPKANSFWQHLDNDKLRLLSYNEIRESATRILLEAGIKETRPYHIKHAVMTCLDENGVSAKDIAAFARHRFESMTAYKHYVSYDGGKKSVGIIASSIKKKN